MDTIFDIEQKQNSQEMLDYANGKPTKFFLFADEFNAMTETAIQNTIDNLQMDLYWQNINNMMREFGDEKNNFYGNLQLLGVHIKNNDLFNYAEKVTLMIDRYRPKRSINRNGETKPSGYKHCRNLDLGFRRNEIGLIQTNTIIDFGQEYHFNIGNRGIKTSGAGYKYQGYNQKTATDYLQFRVVVRLNKVDYESKPLGHLQMICQAAPIRNIKPQQSTSVKGNLTTIPKEYNISYKLT